MARSPTYSETVLADQPAAYWRLTSASTITDAAGHVTVGTATACTSTAGLLAGDTDTALAFNGASSRAVVPTSATISFSTAFTFEAWIKPTSVSGTQTIFRKPNEYEIRTAGSMFQVVTTTSASGATHTETLPVLVPATPYHFVYAMDRSSRFACINGGTYSFAAAPVNPPPIDTGSSGFTIGSGSGFFSGTIDDVAVYNYKLSEQQAFSHYIAGASATPSASTVVVEIAFLGNATEDYFQQASDDSPILYYRLSETSGTSFGNFATVTISATTVPNAIAHGTVTLNQTSVLANDSTDKSVKFDGTTAYADVQDVSQQYSFNPLTMEVWVKPTVLPASTAFIVSKDNAYFLGVTSVGKIVTILQNSPNSVTLASAGTISAGTWSHLSSTYTGSTVSQYVNGVIDSSGTYTSGIQTNGTSVVFGSLRGTAAFFSGTIDEPAVYNSALGADRVGVHYGARNNQRPLVWTDISTYVRGYSYSGGRQHELDRYEAATLNLTVNNDDRRFEAEFASSPYYPNVQPYRRVRVWESKDGVRFPVFAGWIERWPQAWVNQSYHSEVQIQAVDGFDLMNGAVIDATDIFNAGAVTQSADAFVVAYLTSGGYWDENEYPIVRPYNQGVQSVNSTDTSVSVLSLVQTYETTENGEFFIDRFGRPTFVVRSQRVGAPVLGTFGDASGEVPYRNIAPSLDRDRIINDVRVTRQGGTEQQAINYSSVVTYGRRGFSFSTLNVADADALVTAQSILNPHITASRRFDSIDMLYADGGSNQLLVQLLSRGIGDRIKVRRRPDRTAPSSVMEEECLISHVSITRSPKQMAVTWQLIPAP